MELIPLMLTIGAVPGLPLFTTETPATRPCKASETSSTGSAFKVLLFTWEIAPVTSVRRWVP